MNGVKIYLLGLLSGVSKAICVRTWGRLGLTCMHAYPCALGTSLLSPSIAVRYFLKNKVSPDLCNEDGLTALHQVSWAHGVPHLPAPHMDRGPISLHFLS